MYDICVIGGGASGLISAVQAKRNAPELNICVLERLPRVGKKLIATGNGRCNLTNMHASQDRYHGGTNIMAEAMRRYPPTEVIRFFQSIGVEPLYEDNKVYPRSEQASSVLDALRLTLDELGVEVLCEFDVKAISPGFVITARDGRVLNASKIILAAGGMSSPTLGGTESGYQLLQSLGHRVLPRLPALVQLKTPTESIRALTGIKYQGAISIFVQHVLERTEQGEVLFTEYGLSGPPVLQLSRIASAALNGRKQVNVRLEILSESPLPMLQQRRANLSSRPLSDFLTGMLNKRLGQTLLKLAGCAPLSRLAGSLTDFELDTLSDLMTNWVLPVTGTQGFQSAQVTAGGLDTREVDPLTLESKLVPGLYITGELLDIDGDCGGFNLQWAWASGLLAADAVAGGQA